MPTSDQHRITESLDRVVDAIPLPENDTSGNASIMLSFRNFAIQIQQLPQDNTSFTPNLTQLIMGIGDMSNTMSNENVNTTGSVTLPPELTNFQSVAFAVFLRTSLYPPSNVNSSVGSIIISVSIPNQIVDNLQEPVNFIFEKNEVRSINFITRIVSTCSPQLFGIVHTHNLHRCTETYTEMYHAIHCKGRPMNGLSVNLQINY